MSSKILDAWAQGDFVFADVSLPFISNDGDGLFVGDVPVAGVVVISQTCDLLKDHLRRPYAQVAPLVKKSSDEIARVQKGLLPQFATTPLIAREGMVCDLDLVVSIDKVTLSSWTRSTGCESDEERRQFARMLSRHKHRFAFPDRFVEDSASVRDWLESKRSKKNDVGEFIRAISEIRVLGDWEDLKNPIIFYCVFPQPVTPQQIELWKNAIKKLTELIKSAYAHAEVELVGYAELSAAEYLASDRYDEGVSAG